jgi:hypothetical protein
VPRATNGGRSAGLELPRSRGQLSTEVGRGVAVRLRLLHRPSTHVELLQLGLACYVRRGAPTFGGASGARRRRQAAGAGVHDAGRATRARASDPYRRRFQLVASHPVGGLRLLEKRSAITAFSLSPRAEAQGESEE